MLALVARGAAASDLTAQGSGSGNREAGVGPCLSDPGYSPESHPCRIEEGTPTLKSVFTVGRLESARVALGADADADAGGGLCLPPSLPRCRCLDPGTLAR